jgi:peptide/nickel transport system ATP-binding protein
MRETRLRPQPKANNVRGSTEPALLEVDHLSTSFVTDYGVVHAVEDVSLTVASGQTLGIVGESGCGKTVLARSILGLLPRRNTVRSGSVRLAGRELTTLSDADLTTIRGKEVAMIFQDPMAALNPVMTVGRQIVEVLRLHLGLGRRESRERAIDLLEQVGIPASKQRFDDYPHQLSGGMCQRAMIAIAIACEPRLLLADEPTTALDVTIQAQVLDLLQDLRERHGMAMILVTHDLGVVAGHVDEIAVMYAGQFVEQAATHDLFYATRHPYTRALLNSIPKLENPSHTPLEIIRGRPPALINPPVACHFAPRCPRAAPRCHAEEPLMEAALDRHTFRCFFPLEASVDEAAFTNAPTWEP